MKRLYVRSFAIALLLFHAHEATADVLCSKATLIPPGVSTALSTATSLIGVLPEEELPATVSKINAVGGGIVTVEALNSLCESVKDKDWVAAYIEALPFIADLTGAEVAPLVAITAELAGRELEAIRKLATVIGMGRLAGPDEMTYSVTIDKYVKYWFNSSLAPSEISKHVVGMRLVAYRNNASQEFELHTCFAGDDVECKDKLTAGTGGAGADDVGDDFQWLLRIEFKNKQWFLIPIDASSINVSGTDYAAPFLLKNGRYYYNK